MMSMSRTLLVGLFVIGGVLLFAIGLFWIGDRRLLFSESVELAAEFSNLSSLKAGSKVLVSGMDAGEVLGIQVPARPSAKFRVRFRVLEKFLPILRTDSVASIQVEGLVGSKVLQVDAGSDEAPPVRAGTVIRSTEPVEIADVVEETVETIRKANQSIDEVQVRVITAVETMGEFGAQARDVTRQVGEDAGELFATSKKIAKDVDALIDGVRQGRGTVGKLLNDDSLYLTARKTIEHVEAAAGNARATTQDVKAIAADMRSRNLGETAARTAANLQDVTGQVKQLLGRLSPAEGSGDRGLMDDARMVLRSARAATADLAENMEALKRNWFFRGFYTNRGFYDLDSVTVDEYLQGKLAPERAREREWLHEGEVFTTGPNGEEMLSEAGRKRLDKVIAPYLRHAPNTLLIIEGYSSQGSEDERFLRSRDRAEMVRHYLIDRFGLKPTYVGTMPMGGVKSESGEFFDGLGVVYFPEEASNKR